MNISEEDNNNRSIINIKKEYVRWAYRLFLDREPENEEELNILYGDIKELKQIFLSSEEFIINNSSLLLSINNSTSMQSIIPPSPKKIPEQMLDEYTMKGIINILYQYFDDRSIYLKRVHNTVETYNTAFEQIDKGIFNFYGLEGMALIKAIEKYPIQDMNVIVWGLPGWGLPGCDCEAISLRKSARKVYLIQDNKPICDNNKIYVLNHEELSQSAIMADFAISYSTFEHDGLGRFGDPLTANGDLYAIKKAHKHLLNNGILFLGVPLGQDCIVWNGHRIYGKYRLPLLLKGWELLDIFDVNEKTTPEYPFDLELGSYIQNVLVLKKMDTDYPDDDILFKKIYSDSGHNPDTISMHEKINSYIYDYKSNCL